MLVSAIKTGKRDDQSISRLGLLELFHRVRYHVVYKFSEALKLHILSSTSIDQGKEQGDKISEQPAIQLKCVITVKPSTERQ